MKSKGTRAERELVHLFYEAGWSAIRSAGSGSMPLPSPDVLAGNGKRYVAVECKAIAGTAHYFPQDEIAQLQEFATRFGAEPWIGIRFDKKDWFFIPLEEVQQSKGAHFVVTLAFAQAHGFTFEALASRQNHSLPERLP